MALQQTLLAYEMPSKLDEIGPLASRVQHALHEHKHLIFPVNFCLEELITNSITHGLKGATDRVIGVTLSTDGQWLEVEIRDDAPAYDPFTQAPQPDIGQSLHDRRIGGLGVYLTKKMMHECHWQRQANQNVLTLRRPLERTHQTS